MNNFSQILEGIGFSKQASQVYLSLLELGTSSVTDIAQNTQLHREQIYRVLPYLQENQFIHVIENGKRKLYSPGNPQRIYLEYNKRLEENTSAIEQMKQQYENLQNKTQIIHARGEKAIHQSYYDIVESMEKGETFYRITTEKDSALLDEKYIPKDYRKKRDAKDIQRVIIMSDETQKHKKPKLERELKVIHKGVDDFDDNIIYNIYADKVSLIDLNTESSIIIQNKEIADFHRKIFKMLYKKI